MDTLRRDIALAIRSLLARSRVLDRRRGHAGAGRRGDHHAGGRGGWRAPGAAALSTARPPRDDPARPLGEQPGVAGRLRRHPPHDPVVQRDGRRAGVGRQPDRRGAHRARAGAAGLGHAVRRARRGPAHRPYDRRTRRDRRCARRRARPPAVGPPLRQRRRRGRAPGRHQRRVVSRDWRHAAGVPLRAVLADEGRGVGPAVAGRSRHRSGRPIAARLRPTCATASRSTRRARN